MCVLTAFISMVMLVCGLVWLSDGEQEFTEDDSWTTAVCWGIETTCKKTSRNLLEELTNVRRMLR